MLRRFAVVALVTAYVLCLSSSPAPAAEDVLKLVPEAASGFLLINQPGPLDAKLQAFAAEMKVPLPPPLMMLKMQSGIKEGLDEKGTVAVVLLPPESEGTPPTPIVLVPVTDFAKFVEPFGPEASGDVTQITISRAPCWARSIGGYAAITDSAHKDAITSTLKLSSEVPAALAPWRQWLADNDAAAVILPPGIKRIAALAQQGIDRTKATMQNLGDKAQAGVAVFDIYGRILQAAAREVSAFGVGLQIDKQNSVRIMKRTALVAGGTWANALTQAHPPKENLLNGLPDRSFVAAGGGAVSAPFWDAMRKFSVEMMKATPKAYGLGEEKIKKLPEFAFESMKQISGMSMVFGVGKSGESLYGNMIVINRVNDVKAYMAAYEKDMKQYADFVKAADLPALQPIEVEPSDFGGAHALQITITAPKFPEGQQAQPGQKMLEYFFGPEGKVTGWIVPVDEHNVVLGYVNKDLLQQTIDALKQGKPALAANAEIAKTAAMLPPDAVTVVYISPQGTIEFVKQTVLAAIPFAGNLKDDLPDFPKTPPFGFAINTAPNEVQTTFVIPADILRAIAPYVAKFQAIRSGATTTAPATKAPPKTP